MGGGKQSPWLQFSPVELPRRTESQFHHVESSTVTNNFRGGGGDTGRVFAAEAQGLGANL